jgi:PTH1 family peptidyl-tRNA hydrolase
MILLVGLGNPGDKYKETRHNIGFRAVDEIVHRFNFSGYKAKFSSHMAEGVIEGNKVIVLKPLTYMNDSGRAVREIAKFYKIELSEIIVFHDDLDLTLAKVRVKVGGGAGGHNGLKSIDSHLGKEYTRVRIGIDHPGNRDDVTNYVLGGFNKDESKKMDELMEVISYNISYLIAKEADLFMNKLAI